MALKTIIIQAGECAVLPSNATVKAIVVSGSATATSDCPLPAPEAYKCWTFRWEHTNDDNAYSDARFTGIKIGDTVYNLDGVPVSQTNRLGVDGALYLRYALPIAVPNGLIKNGSIVYSHGYPTYDWIKIEIPESLGQPILFWTNPGYEDTAAFYGLELCDGTIS